MSETVDTTDGQSNPEEKLETLDIEEDFNALSYKVDEAVKKLLHEIRACRNVCKNTAQLVGNINESIK